MNQEFLKLKIKAKKQAEQYKPIQAYSRDTIASNLYKCFTARYPEGSPSDALTRYAIHKTKILPAYPIR